MSLRTQISFGCTLCLVVLALPGRVAGQAGDPVALRIDNFTVPPATGPLAFVRVKNLLAEPYSGTVSLSGPEGWRIVPADRKIELAAGQLARVPFTVERAGTSAGNMYDCRATAAGDGARVESNRTVSVASAPYFKPVIDGDPEDWQAAIPLTFTTGGKTTVVSTYWNRRSFSLLVAVEEDDWTGRGTSGAEGAFDAVQFALAPGGAVTPDSPDGVACRYEFLLCREGSAGKAACYRLAEPGTPLPLTQQPRALGPLIDEEASVAVRRSGKVSYYECSLPMKPMQEQLRPSEGREFCFGLLVHDPDGTGIRDLGAAAGLWPWERSWLAWSRWPGAKWPDEPPYDSKTPWGMCSSKF